MWFFIVRHWKKVFSVKLEKIRQEAGEREAEIERERQQRMKCEEEERLLREEQEWVAISTRLPVDYTYLNEPSHFAVLIVHTSLLSHTANYIVCCSDSACTYLTMTSFLRAFNDAFQTASFAHLLQVWHFLKLYTIGLLILQAFSAQRESLQFRSVSYHGYCGWLCVGTKRSWRQKKLSEKDTMMKLRWVSLYTLYCGNDFLCWQRMAAKLKSGEEQKREIMRNIEERRYYLQCM